MASSRIADEATASEYTKKNGADDVQRNNEHLLYHCANSDDDEVKLLTRNAIEAAKKLQAKLGVDSDVVLLVDSPCPDDIRAVERFSRKQKARIAIVLEGTRLQKVLAESSFEKVQCSTHLRHALSFARRAEKRRNRSTVLLEQSRASKNPGIPDWLLDERKEYKRAAAKSQMFVHPSIVNALLPPALSKRKLSRLYGSFCDSFWKRATKASIVQGPFMLTPITPPWLRQHCIFIDIFTRAPFHNFPFHALPRRGDTRISDNHKAVAAILCAWLARESETRDLLVDALSEEKVIFEDSLLRECFATRSEETWESFMKNRNLIATEGGAPPSLQGRVLVSAPPKKITEVIRIDSGGENEIRSGRKFKSCSHSKVGSACRKVESKIEDKKPQQLSDENIESTEKILRLATSATSKSRVPPLSKGSSKPRSLIRSQTEDIIMEDVLQHNRNTLRTRAMQVHNQSVFQPLSVVNSRPAPSDTLIVFESSYSQSVVQGIEGTSLDTSKRLSKEVNSSNTVDVDTFELSEEFKHAKAKDPVVLRVNSINLFKSDIDALNMNQILSDRVINAYLSLLPDPENLVLDSSFITHQQKMLTYAQKNFTQFSVCKRIFIPLFKEKHWALAVMDKSTGIISIFDSLPELKTFTDSITGILAFAAEMKRHICASNPWPSTWNLDTTPANRHRQENGVDCGAFVCLHAGFFETHGAVPQFCTPSPDVLRKFLLNSLLRRSLQEHDILLGQNAE